MGSIKERCNQWCETTTCAGIIDYHLASTKVSKIFWLSFIVAALLVTIWQTTMLIITCINDNPYETITSVVSDEPMRFPSLTVCNFSPLDKNKINFEPDAEILNYGLLPLNMGNVSGMYSNINTSEIQWQQMLRKLGVKGVYEIIDKYGHSCQNMFVYCVFAQQQFDCCSRAKPVIAGSGKCWYISPPPFNSFGDTPEQNTPGQLYGLQIVINPEINSYINGLSNADLYQQGVLVQAGFSEAITMTNIKVIPPGTKSWLSLTAVKHTVKTESTPLYQPYCRQNTTLNYINAAYSKENCITDCWADVYHKTCNCTVLSEVRKPYRVCEAKEILQCVSQKLCILNKTNSGRLCREISMTCRTDCLNSCDPYWEVDMSQTSAKFIGNHMRQNLLDKWRPFFGTQNLTNETLDALIGISLYYPSLSYSQTETGETNPIFVVIGNVGGQLSMWLGISFVTIVQAIWYLFGCLSIKATRNNDVAQNKSF